MNFATMTDDHIDSDIIGGIDYLFSDDTLTLKLTVVRTVPTQEEDSELNYLMQYFTRDEAGNEYPAGDLFTEVFEPKHWLEAYLVQAERDSYGINHFNQNLLLQTIREFREASMLDVTEGAIATEMELVLSPKCEDLDGAVITLSVGEAFEDDFGQAPVGDDGEEVEVDEDIDTDLPAVFTDYYSVITLYPKYAKPQV